jgi:hypothetical protein
MIPSWDDGDASSAEAPQNDVGVGRCLSHRATGAQLATYAGGWPPPGERRHHQSSADTSPTDEWAAHADAPIPPIVDQCRGTIPAIGQPDRFWTGPTRDGGCLAGLSLRELFPLVAGEVAERQLIADA